MSVFCRAGCGFGQYQWQGLDGLSGLLPAVLEGRGGVAAACITWSVRTCSSILAVTVQGDTEGSACARRCAVQLVRTGDVERWSAGQAGRLACLQLYCVAHLTMNVFWRTGHRCWPFLQGTWRSCHIWLAVGQQGMVSVCC
jgi:hypothetical protein